MCIFYENGDDMILEGKTLKKQILNDLKEDISELDIKPSLVVIQVGNDEASNVYVNQKRKMSESVGINYIHRHLDSNITEEELINIIELYNSDDSIDGILVQMPLPEHINEARIQNTVLYTKDVDGLTDENAGRLLHDKDALVSCTPYGIIELLKYYNIDFEGKNVVIVGRSNLVGKPLCSLFLKENATVTMCHSKTKDLSFYTKQADILVVAVGKKHLITKDMVKKGSTIIDVGINRVDDKLYGDVDFDSVKDIANITPVPGGVGQMTVAELGKNVYKAYCLRRKK